MLKPERNDIDEDEILDGVYIGVVTNNNDPDNQGRVKVRFPWLDDTIESHWARLATLYAGKGRGSYFVPEVGDEVLMVFELGDMNQPFIIGSLWNGKDKLPEPGHPDGKDNHKVLETRSGHKLTFDDTDGKEVISLVDSSKNNRVVIDVAADSISILAATGDIFIKAPAGSVNFLSKTQSVSVKETKDHTSGVKHSISVTKSDYAETVDSGKTLTVGGSTSRSAKAIDIKASSSLTTAGGSAELAVSKSGAMVMKGPVTQTVGKATRKLKVDLDHSALKTWTVGMSTFDTKGAFSIDAKALTIMAGLFNGEAKSGQFALLGSPVMHLGGLINLKADQIGFKPGG